MKKVKFNQEYSKLIGILLIIGTISGILSIVFGGDVLVDTSSIATINDNRMQLITGAIFILIMAFTLAMVPVVVYPLIKNSYPRLALGSVIFRGALEAIMYILIAMTWLMLVFVTDSPLLDSETFITTKLILLALSQASSQILSIVFSIGTLMMYYCLYKTGLLLNGCHYGAYLVPFSISYIRY